MEELVDMRANLEVDRESTTNRGTANGAPGAPPRAVPGERQALQHQADSKGVNPTDHATYAMAAGAGGHVQPCRWSRLEISGIHSADAVRRGWQSPGPAERPDVASAAGRVAAAVKHVSGTLTAVVRSPSR